MCTDIVCAPYIAPSWPETHYFSSQYVPLAIGTASPKVLAPVLETVSSNSWPVLLCKHPTSLLDVGQFRMAISV